MLAIDAVTGILTIPIWAAGAASAVFLVLVVLAIGRAGAGTFVNALLRVGVVVVGASAVWLYMQRAERQEHAAERRAFDERAAALLTSAVAPGSALSCLEELAGDTIEAACEKAVFARPETVASAVTYVAAKLAVLADGNDPARRDDPAFAAKLAPLLAALEFDRFGLVAHVLAIRHGCTAEKCDALNWFSNQSHVLANLRENTFDEQVTKFSAIWDGAQRMSADGAAGAVPTVAHPNLSAAPAAVSPRYDFPSSQSIPPVNIMVPEQAVPRAGAANGQAATPPADGNSRAATAPVPPRRPPQVRAPSTVAGSRPANPQPIAPVTVGEVPAEGAVPHTSGSIQPQ